MGNQKVGCQQHAVLPSLRLIASVALGLIAVLSPGHAMERVSPAIRTTPRSAAALFAAPQDNVQGFVLSAQQYARAVGYRHEGYWLYFVTTGYTLFILPLLIGFKVAPRLRDWAESLTHRRWLQFVLFGPTLLLIFGILLFPTDAWDQWRMRRYGVSVQGWGSWFRDWTTAEAATAVCGAVGVTLLYYVIRRSPHRWWLFMWGIAIPLLVLLVFIQPIAIDPLFETYEPLSVSNPELVSSIEVLLGRARISIPSQHIYLLKVSDKSTEVDASSEGFGPTKSIFVTDTMIASESRAALLHTLGHEIGHYLFTVDWIVFAICIPLSLALLYFSDRLFVWTLGRWGKQWNLRGRDDWASLPVLAFIMSSIAIILTPAVNTLSRYRESAADRYGLELIDGIVPNVREAAAQAFQRDGEINLSDPDPPAFIKWWLFDHPPVNDRIIFCRTYHLATPQDKARTAK